MQKKNFFALLVLIIVAIGFLVLNNSAISGFFGLGAKTEATVKQENEDNNAKNAEGAGLGAVLSIEVLKNSRVSAELVLQQSIPNCPETTDANILVKNLGHDKIEALKIKTAPQLQIKACANCIIESLGIGESRTISLKLCNARGENQSIIVSSANSEPVEIKIEKSK